MLGRAAAPRGSRPPTLPPGPHGPTCSWAQPSEEPGVQPQLGTGADARDFLSSPSRSPQTRRIGAPSPTSSRREAPRHLALVVRVTWKEAERKDVSRLLEQLQATARGRSAEKSSNVAVAGKKMLYFLVLGVLITQKLVTASCLLRKGLTDSSQLTVTDKILIRKQYYNVPRTHFFVSHSTPVTLCFMSRRKAADSWLSDHRMYLSVTIENN